MSEQNRAQGDGASETDRADAATRANEEHELEAEEESAAAMDADVPQPPGADKTTEGQPS